MGSRYILSEDALRGSASSAMTTLMFGWKLMFVPVIFSVVRSKLTLINRRLRKIQWTTRIRVCTSNRLIDLRVPWATRPCNRLRSNSVLARYDWRPRHTGLMAIVAVGEDTSKVCSNCLFVARSECNHTVLHRLVWPMFNNSHLVYVMPLANVCKWRTSHHTFFS
jgi:hypothetical protein